jgi:hypothetical protein
VDILDLNHEIHEIDTKNILFSTVYFSNRISVNKADFHDGTFGFISYNEELDYYKGEIKIKDSPIILYLEADDRDDLAPALDRAKQLLPEFDKYSESAKEYAAKELLNLKNESWIDEDETSLNAEEFKSLMTLESVVFNGAREVTFYHDDGDLFWGHTIEVRMNESDQFYQAGIAG